MCNVFVLWDNNVRIWWLEFRERKCKKKYKKEYN